MREMKPAIEQDADVQLSKMQGQQNFGLSFNNKISTVECQLRRIRFYKIIKAESAQPQFTEVSEKQN